MRVQVLVKDFLAFLGNVLSSQTSDQFDESKNIFNCQLTCSMELSIYFTHPQVKLCFKYFLSTISRI